MRADKRVEALSEVVQARRVALPERPQRADGRAEHDGNRLTASGRQRKGGERAEGGQNGGMGRRAHPGS